ncbi:hypothetical protein H351_31825 (plasmid) [Rhodococcus erythropolis R138]|nr:hypothetical protein H351_31825 [Rhodococcus erythropolis R138]
MVSECSQPIRSAITVAGIRGYSDSSCRICGSTPSGRVGLGGDICSRRPQLLGARRNFALFWASAGSL